MKKSVLSLFSFFLSFTLCAQTQVVTGEVHDEASGLPLEGATIIIGNIEPRRGTEADHNGKFRFDRVPLGRHTIAVSKLGYEERIIADIVVTAGKAVFLNIVLTEAIRQLTEIVIDGAQDAKAKNKMALVSGRSFNMEDTRKFAGALGDPSRMAANFAGVISGNDSRNDIVIRGNSPTGMLWQLEGLNIPNPNHFGTFYTTGGPISMLNSNNIARSDFFTGAFPAQYGNALSGVFDINLRSGNTEKNEFVAQVGFNGFELGAEGPVSKKNQASYLVNYRYSTLGVFKALGIDFGTGSAVPLYQDINYKISSRAGKNGKISVFGIMGGSDVNFLGHEVDTTRQDIYGDIYRNSYNRFLTTVTGIHYTFQASSKTTLKFIAGYSSTAEKYSLDSISYIDSSVHPSVDARFRTGKFSFAANGIHKINARHSVQAGMSYDHTNFSMMNKEMHPGEPDIMYVSNDGSLGLAQAYLQWRGRFGNRFTLTGGLHAQYLAINDNMASGSRAGLQYAISPGHVLGAGYGRHYQAQHMYVYYLQTPVNNGVQYTNKSLKFTRSDHYILTYGWNISPTTRFRAEGYYQRLGKVPVEQTLSSYSSLNMGAGFELANNDSLVNKGSGYNYGLDITLEQSFHKGFYFMVTASALNSKYRGSDGIKRNTAFNTGHVVNVLGGKEWKVRGNDIISVNIRVSTVGGKYMTPIDVEWSDRSGRLKFREEEAFSEKGPSYFRADLKFGFRRELKRSTFEFSMDFQNITNHKNVFARDYNIRQRKLYYLYQQGFFPVPTARFTF
ncbi:TonB-dependent receptor [Agriterribacter sp.]|uniref:TonB-dependent receptor n=1 Tax=Agriterribacter sp. TaxID=2821509 RepID=UPI002BF4D76C|nr:TonB-dependent receptor [Agriterribacter sp.]HTN09047.1 TonB-dependent receptor [Agriterribacter sp.]